MGVLSFVFDSHSLILTRSPLEKNPGRSHISDLIVAVFLSAGP